MRGSVGCVPFVYQSNCKIEGNKSGSFEQFELSNKSKSSSG